MPVVDREPALSMSATLSHPTPEGEPVGVCEDLPTVSFDPTFPFEPQASIAGDDNKRPTDELANAATDPTGPEEVIPANAGGNGADLPPPVVPSLSPETPDEEPDRRKEPIDIGDAFIFEEPTLTIVRERFADERVMVIDYNGVLANTPEGIPLEGNPQAKETLRQLKQLGYSLVLWTSASRRAQPQLVQLGLTGYFDLQIFEGNYYHGKDYNLRCSTGDKSIDASSLFSQAIETAQWLRSEDREELNSEHVLPYQKTPQLLFREAGIVDDSKIIVGYLDYSPNDKYPFFQVSQFGSAFGKFAPFFTPDLIPEIVTRFPPPQMED